MVYEIFPAGNKKSRTRKSGRERDEKTALNGQALGVAFLSNRRNMCRSWREVSCHYKRLPSQQTIFGVSNQAEALRGRLLD